MTPSLAAAQARRGAEELSEEDMEVLEKPYTAAVQNTLLHPRGGGGSLRGGHSYESEAGAHEYVWQQKGMIRLLTNRKK